MNDKPRTGRPLFGQDGPSPKEWFLAGVAFGIGFMAIVYLGVGLTTLVKWLIG